MIVERGDGSLWMLLRNTGGLLLDDRESSYPDGVQARDGTIYIIYDYKRMPNGEVLMATFTDEDARTGQPVSDKVRLRGEVARLPVEEDDRSAK